MALILVEHDAEEPALYGMMAAVVARARDAAFAHLPTRFDPARYPDAVQHVTADGHLVPSGLVWVERLCGLAVGRAADAQEIVAHARQRSIVVPHRTRAVEANGFASLRAAARVAGVPIETVTVRRQEDGFHLSGAGFDEVWSRDAFGRPARGRPARHSELPAPLPIALVGSERDHRDSYPAVLAALGDAADALGFSVSIRFVEPRASQEALADLGQVGGIVLPGGSDMANVAGQIEVASAAIARRIPLLGLCLGMQTMATAVARTLPGLADADLAELAPRAPIHTFIPMAAAPNLVPHRLGEAEFATVARSRLAAIVGPSHRLRTNHRFRLNPALVTPLARAGLAVSARGVDGAVADGVELLDHTFCLGLQGHPELSSRPGSAHPVIAAFLLASQKLSMV